jgi:hypothetical protein
MPRPAPPGDKRGQGKRKILSALSNALSTIANIAHHHAQHGLNNIDN